VPAGVSRCFKRRPRMRVLQVGAGNACTQSFLAKQAGRWVSLRQGSGSGECVLTGGAGHNAHTKEVTGTTRLSEVVGRWILIPPAHVYERSLGFNEWTWGQVVFGERLGTTHKGFGRIFKKVFGVRYLYGSGNG